MFLFDPGFAGDFSKVEQEIQRIMDRAECRIVMSRKWEERKLAYPIAGRKRGCYVLTFFQASPDRISGIERDVRLSEHVLRVLVTRADHLNEADMERAFAPRTEAVEGGAGGERSGEHGYDAEGGRGGYGDRRPRRRPHGGRGEPEPVTAAEGRGGREETGVDALSD